MVGAVQTKQGHDIGPLINQYAAANGLAPRALLAQVLAESNLDEQAERWGAWPDWSFGLTQFTVLYAPVGDHTASTENVNYVKAYYFQPEHALADAARWLGNYWQQFADLPDRERYLETASRYNGGPNLAYADNPNAANFAQAWDRAGAYEPQEAPVAHTYDPTVTPVRQTDDWSCSVASTATALHSLGLAAPYPGLEGDFIAAGLATPAHGLEDGSATALAAWLHTTYGLTTDHTADASWDWLTARAGQGPILLGGHGLYHWVCVLANEGDWLRLANPAPSWRGIGDDLSRAEFAAWGPWAAIHLPGEDAVDDTLLAYLQDAGRTARENIEKALAVPRLPPAAREALQYGALPAAQTIERGGAPTD